MVEQDERSKLYRLGMDLFALAARRQCLRPAQPVPAGAAAPVRQPGDTVFLLVRSRFDAVCVDRVDGPFPAPSPATSAGASRWAWARALAILAFLPEQEREEVIRYNVPRLREFGVYDEVYLRTEIERVRETGYAARQAGLLDGMAGLAVPLFDVAAPSSAP
jgi:DNA-binding IclR family transcriptional regulator